MLGDFEGYGCCGSEYGVFVVDVGVWGFFFWDFLILVVEEVVGVGYLVFCFCMECELCGVIGCVVKENSRIVRVSGGENLGLFL